MKTDIIFTAVAYLLTVAGFVVWIFKTKPDRVARNRRAMVSLSLRAALLYLLMMFVCQALGISVVAGVAILAVLLFALCGPFFISPTGLVSVGLLYAMQQWILGWPDRALLVNQVALESNLNRLALPDQIVGRSARTTTPLRPGGKVLMDGKEFDASCEFGFLNAGVEVEIVGIGPFNLLVKPKDEAAEQ